MSDPSQSENNPVSEAQINAQNPAETTPETEEAKAAESSAEEPDAELSAEELDEVSGAGLIYLTTGTSTSTVSTTPPPPPATVAPLVRGPTA